MTRKFDLGDVLSITTGRLVSKRGMDGLYDILNYMTGDNLYTHQLPRASDECQPWLLRQHPQLTKVIVLKWKDEADVWQWLTAQEALFGSQLVVEPIPADDHAQKDPIEELEEVAGKGKVIVIRPKEQP